MDGTLMTQWTSQQLKRLWVEQLPDRRHAERKRQMYNNDWKPQLTEEMEKLFADPETYRKLAQRADTSVNLFRWVTNEKGAIYSKPVGRKIMDGEKTVALLDPIPEVDMALDKATKWSEAQGESLVRTTWSAGRMQCLVYPRDRFLAVPKAEDPLALDLVIIQHMNTDNTVNHYEVWTDTTKARLNKDFDYLPEPNEGEAQEDATDDQIGQPNAFGIVPFHVLHAEYPAAEFWHGHTSDDLQAACLTMGVDLTDFGHIKHFQSYLRLFVKTDGTTQTGAQVYKGDPSAVLEGRGVDADAKVLNMQANLGEMLDVILTKSDYTVGLRGLRSTLVREGEQAESGYALKIREHAKEEGWSRLRQLRTLDENKMWEIARVVIPAEGGPSIPEGRLVIDWPELGPGGNPLEKAQVIGFIGDTIGREESLRLLGFSEEEIKQIQARNEPMESQKSAETTRGGVTV